MSQLVALIDAPKRAFSESNAPESGVPNILERYFKIGVIRPASSRLERARAVLEEELM